MVCILSNWLQIFSVADPLPAEAKMAKCCYVMISVFVPNCTEGIFFNNS